MSDIYAEITKINPDRQEVFGWASITKRDGKPVVDFQEDYIEVGELEKSAYEYVLNSRVGGEMHQRMGKSAPKQIGTLIESFVVTPEKVEKMGLPEGSLPEGWWIGFKVNDGDVWKSVKDGKYTGFSIHGRGVRKRESLEDSVNTREQLLKAAFTNASDQMEFTKNIAGIADALHEREHPEAHYFAEVVKHLIGSHEQKDHDPTKKGKGHSRSSHADTPAGRGRKAVGTIGLGGAGAVGLTAGAMDLQEMLRTRRLRNATPLASPLAQQAAFNRQYGALLRGGGKIGLGVAGLAGAASLAGIERKKVKKTLTKKEYETLAKYLG